MTSANTSVVIPAVTVTAPARSKPRLPATGLPVTRRGTTTSDARATGTLIKNTHRHDAAWVITPPSRIPAAKPRPDSAPQMLSAFTRSARTGNRAVTSASAAGVASAAPTPCATRAPISICCDPAKPSASDAVPNTAVPARNMRRRPNRSAARPPASTRPPNTTM